MKKTIRYIAILAAAAMLALCCACTGKHDTKPQKAEFDSALLGDWYGVFKVNEAGGRYLENLGVTDDCIMRAAIGEDGTGVCCCFINGIGGDLFKDCTASADKAGLTVEGTLGGTKIKWRFNSERTESGVLQLRASGFFGNVLDYMRVGFTLRHCGEEWDGSLIPAGLGYTREHGFGGLAEEFGGNTADLPELTAEGVNLRLTKDEAPEASPAPDFFDEGRVRSANGRFSVPAQEGFAVIADSRSVFAIGDGSVEISYCFEDTGLTPLEALSQLMDGSYPAVYHYDISGYDCCCAVIAGEEGSGRLVLYGAKEPGRLLRIEVSGVSDAYELSYLMDFAPPECFTRAVLGLMVK